MGLDETICRICLQGIEEELPFSVLRSNEVLLEDLKLISTVTFNNLHLTDEPSICELCETTVRELATFKRAIFEIEAELEKNRQLDPSLVFDNAETCRLCLHKFETLTKSLRDCEGLLLQCDLLIDFNTEAPGNICQGCEDTLKNLNDFLWTTAKNETLIVDCASKTGLLSSKDLFSISSINCKTEEFVIETVVDEPLQVTIAKTPNTYQKRRLKGNMPSTSKEPIENLNQLQEINTRIDVSPARITDVTLGQITDDFKLALQTPVEDIADDVLSNDNLTLDVVEYQIDDANVADEVECPLINENSTQELVDILKGDEVEAEVDIEPVTEGVTRKRKVKAINEVSNKRRATVKKVAKQEKDVESAEKFKNPVTIIKSTKRTKKAELDKTWQELTGKPNKETTFVKEFKGGMEIELVNTRRGRPKLPETKLKAVKKKHTVWFHCDLCSFKTYSQNSLVAHQLLHNLKGPNGVIFQCNLCSFKSPSEEVMKAHKPTHSVVNLTYKCIFCDDMFKKKVSCMYHTLKHDDQDIASQFYCMVYNGGTEEEFFECYQCPHQDSEEASMPDHVVGHTIEKVKACLVVTYKCDKCQYITKDPDLLHRHKTLHKDTTDTKKGKGPEVKKEPQEEIIYKCDKCNYMTKNKRSLANHKGLKHNRKSLPNLKKKEKRQVYYCNECSYSTDRKVNMPRHQLVHRTKLNMEFFECSHCIFETKHRRSYTRHLESVHQLIS